MREELSIIARQYDLTKWYLNHIENYPRSFKFTIGDETVRKLWKVLELLIEARYDREREETLARANLELEKLRFLTRMSHDMKFISTGSYEYASREIDAVGRMLGGWKKLETKEIRRNGNHP